MRLRFRRGEEVKYISHLDLMRLFVRACRRAGLPLAYSGGFSPTPVIAMALPLAVGVVGENEVLEIGFSAEVTPEEVLVRLRPQLPPGVEVRAAWPAPPVGKALAQLVVAADFIAEVETDRSRTELEQAVREFLTREQVILTRQRGEKTRTFDLRPLVRSLELVDLRDGVAEFHLQLVAENNRAGRPDDVLAALGFEDVAMRFRRVRLYFREPID
ncbi:MAG: radical SAM protein [Dehalococcoidia bacterium]|nr:MAG: radical SAM protein [Dehalococcoidia bacterium]